MSPWSKTRADGTSEGAEGWQIFRPDGSIKVREPLVDVENGEVEELADETDFAVDLLTE